MTIEEYQKYCKKTALRLTDARGKKYKIIILLEDFVYTSLSFIRDAERSHTASIEDLEAIKQKSIETLDDLIKLYEIDDRKFQIYCMNIVKNELLQSNVIRVIK